MLRDLLLQNRSYRGYDESVKVTKAQLEALIELCQLTPSSANLQPLKYLLSCDDERNQKIFNCTKWAGALPDLSLPYEGHRPTGYVVIVVDTTIASNTAPFMKDVGIVAQTMLLGATEMGLGGCMIGAFDAVQLQTSLQLPEHLHPALVVAIGKPDERIVLTTATEGQVKYYRDETDTHYVPKRPLTEVILP